MSVRFDGQDNLTATELMAMIGRSLREGWDVPLPQKRRAVVLLERIALNLDTCYSVRQQLRAIRLLMQMEQSNRQAELQAANFWLKAEKANVIERKETCRTASFAEQTPASD